MLTAPALAATDAAALAVAAAALTALAAALASAVPALTACIAIYTRPHSSNSSVMLTAPSVQDCRGHGRVSRAVRTD